jgi:hypothetical protein
MSNQASTTLVPVEFKGTIESVKGGHRNYRVTINYTVSLIGYHTVSKSSTDGDIVNGSSVELVVIPPHWIDWRKVELILSQEDITIRRAELKEDDRAGLIHESTDEQDAKSVAGQLLASYRNNTAKNAAIENLLRKCDLSLS